MNLMKWLRPSGTIIETAIGKGIEALAKELGWTPAEGKKKRVRRTKAEIEADNARESE